MASLSSTALPSCRIRSASTFGIRELGGGDGLSVQLLPSGAIHAWRHRETLLNQVLPGPAEDGLSRLLVRWSDPAGRPAGWASLAGAGLVFGAGGRAATWRAAPAAGAPEATATLTLHPRLTAWAWRVRLQNPGRGPLEADVLIGQDLGLGDESVVRNNEAYLSHYLDLLPLTGTEFGPVILARQNQRMTGGRHPWLACACVEGAVAYGTDGSQFFGADHRLTNEPAAVREPALPSRRLQYEFAFVSLQSRRLRLEPGASAEATFVFRYLADHPAASGPDDLARLRELLPLDWLAAEVPGSRSPASVFTRAGWVHGAEPSAADWTAWFPGPRRHPEVAPDGRLLSFFHGDNTHVVARRKEAGVARPHGHVLRSGSALWIDDRQFGLTCYAAGVFGAQAYLGNPSLARLLSVVRNHLNAMRASGQRLFLRHDGDWRQLGVPSALALEPGRVRWIYRLPDGTVELRAWCSPRQPASFLELDVTAGPPREFLVTHQLALGANEFDSSGELTVHDDGWIGARPDPDGFTGRHQPGLAFALAARSRSEIAAHGGDELLYDDGTPRQGPYAVFRTTPVASAAFILLGSPDGAGILPEAVAAARAELAAAVPACPPAPPLRLRGDNAAVARLDEILPWFTQNAFIHFSAPHGLEQYGGGAWGVRDVCQGSVEWLLAAGETAVVRRILLEVFAQQYVDGPGGWPQWFMFPPYRAIQQAHSHGDVCFWPVKALCDYAEAANDVDFLATRVGYIDPVRFARTGAEESLWEHCDRIVSLCESRFVGRTALVNYGDGDWDDTLQPADPAMRTRMVSPWTVALAHQALSQLAGLARRAGHEARAARLGQMLARMRADFAAHAMPDGIVAGFLVHEPDGSFRPLLHPRDRITGIRYRLLPMSRAILAGLFTRDEARRHAAIIEEALWFPDGVRLMSEPAAYHGGLERLFRRAETAANVGREIGLQYVHAHLRYAEAMARLGDAARLWRALQLVNPVGLEQVVTAAAPRQANVYFSSSDADFADRIEAARRWGELRAGRVAVRAGWRLYSSGPGLFLHKVRCCLLGVRESFDAVVLDPVLPPELDGLTADLTLFDRPVRLTCRVGPGAAGPVTVTVNGRIPRGTEPEPNPFRIGGLRVPAAELRALLREAGNRIEVRR